MSLKQYIPAIKYGNKLGFDELETSGASNGQVLKYNSTSGEWEPGNETVNPGEIALTSANILVGNGSNVAAGVAMSGDATISNAGALTIANDAVTTAKILNSNVTLAKLDSGITPSHVIKFAAQHTTVGGAAAEAITVTGALNTDLAFVQLVDDGTANVSVLNAVVTADTLTVTFSADPGNDAIINYQIIRAAA